MEDEQGLMGCLYLFRQAQAGADLSMLAARLLDRAKRNAAAADALMDLSWLFSITGQPEAARSTQALALQLQQHYRLPPPAGRSGLRLLALMAPGDYLHNTPLEFLLEGSDVALDLLFLGPGLPFPDHLPDHDVVFTAIHASDENLPLLQEVEERLAHHPGPVLNQPGRIPLQLRDRASELLGDASAVAMPQTRRIPRECLEAHARETSTFPLLVRAVGAHRGEDLQKVEDLDAVARCLDAMAAPTFFVTPFVDYRSPDGQFRKIRIVLIDGRPHVAHLAISSHWMVNYVNAHMETSVEKRAEEAAFMAGFDEGFARRHAPALGAIQTHLQLDYLVVDCAETPDGRLLIFEVDSSALVHACDPVDLFPYKQPQMRKLFDAFRAMLDRTVRGNETRASTPSAQ